MRGEQDFVVMLWDCIIYGEPSLVADFVCKLGGLWFL